MSDSQTYPYVTRMDPLFQSLELVDEKKVAAACKDRWFNQTLCAVNDSLVRVGVVQGEYHWHKHDNDDEFFYVLVGRLFVDLADRTFELAARQGVVIPKGVLHRTRAPQRTVILMIETKAVVPTGS
jgi:mannose-6-phosphate isomerase-like protein (cupin superfamily)